MEGSIRKKYRPLVTLLTILVYLLPLVVVGHVDAAEQPEPAKGMTSLDVRMEKPITYSCSDTSIDLVLEQLAEHANVDFIKSRGVEGNITVKFTNIPLREALANILDSYGWGYIQTQNMIKIKTLDEIDAREQVQRDKVAEETVIPLQFVSKTYRIDYADINAVASALDKSISKGGSVVVVEGSSVIMVTELQDRMVAMDAFMKMVDRQTPQIVVEVRIYDITHKNQLDLGVEWSAGRTTSFDSAGNPVGGRLDPFLVAGFSGGSDSAESAEGMIRFGILTGSHTLDAVLTAQEEIIDAELLANPRIRVLDNIVAIFENITEIPYTEQSQTSAGGQMTSTVFKNVGVMLTVVPHVVGDDMVRMDVTSEFGIVVQRVADGPPTVDTRKTSTSLLVKDGQTIVMGGMRKKETRFNVRKVPFLGDIPLLGLLFRSKAEEVITSELVLFITPRIVKEEERALTESELRYLEKTDFAFPLSSEDMIIQE